ncbi:hypothetical protein QFZ63_000037 [Streptomyces sp. B3I7]|uniref:hypothetical protein n=1 Tax=Streptomyces sp. B3I7 TaxID=3042269 RepID=UPI00278B9D14|nr:hypothetical protein [Streptomyces sp. B3I7]MDQ0808323.1 hypothetical protein [Streptomyces sp. B3I7]
MSVVDNLRWAELLPCVATDLSPFVKSLGKFQDSLGLYGLGTGIAGLEGVNHIIKEVHAAYQVWMQPDQEHVKPSFTRFAFGVVNVAGYGLYGAGAGGFLGRYGTGGGLLLVTASNVLKQHFLPVEQRYRPKDPVLPLYRSDTAANLSPAADGGDTSNPIVIARCARMMLPTPSASPDALAVSPATPGQEDRWLEAGIVETGTVRPVSSGPHGQVHRSPRGTPVSGAAVGEIPITVHSAAAVAGALPSTPAMTDFRICRPRPVCLVDQPGSATIAHAAAMRPAGHDDRINEIRTSQTLNSHSNRSLSGAIMPWIHTQQPRRNSL